MKHLKLFGLLAVMLLMLFTVACGDNEDSTSSSKKKKDNEKKATATPAVPDDNKGKTDDKKSDDDDNNTKSTLLKDVYYNPSGPYQRYSVVISFYTDKTLVYVEDYGSGAPVASAAFPKDQYLGTVDGYYNEEVGPSNPGTMTVTEENGELKIDMVYYDMNDSQKKKEISFDTFVKVREIER